MAREKVKRVNGHKLKVLNLDRMGNDLKKEYTIFGLYECKKCHRYYNIHEEEKNGKRKDILNEAKDEKCKCSDSETEEVNNG